MGYTGLGGLMLWPLLLLGFIGKEFVTAEKVSICAVTQNCGTNY